MKQKRPPPRDSKPARPEVPQGLGTLGEKLGIPVKREKKFEPPPERPKPPPPAAPAIRQVTEMELMALAFDAVGKTHGRDAKFTGEGFKADNVVLIADREEPRPGAAAATVAEPKLGFGEEATSDDLMFFATVNHGLRPLEEKKLALEQKVWVGCTWHDERQITTLTAEQLHEPELTPTQRDVLRRSSKEAEVPWCNLRHLPRIEALQEVDAFVRRHVAAGTRFVRVIHGKGRNSPGEPVLKPAIVNWGRHEGAKWILGWAPETDVSGQFGSVVFELRRAG